jgi:hypothetical protein
MTYKIFCIGFHKTGTSSLAKALQLLDFRICRRMGMLQDHVTKKNILEQLKNEEFNEIFEAVREFDAFCDNPWPILFKELDKKFPNSKFILTIREEDNWIKSVLNYFKDYETEIRSLIYGMASPLGNEEIYLERYRKHNAEVIEYFKDRPDDLQVINLADQKGWTELCLFLKKPIPKENFPHENKAQYLLDESQEEKKKGITSSRFINFFRLPSRDKFLFFETGFILFISRLLVFLFPFKTLAKLLGKHMEESPQHISYDQREKSRKVGRSIKKISLYAPFRSMCFEQAMTCKFMLNRRGISSTIYFGVAKDQNQKLRAHAWTRSANLILTGAKGRHLFNVVSTFGN